MANFLGKISEKYISLSSQVDVYRNIKGYKFNHMLSFDDEIKIYNKICSSFYKLSLLVDVLSDLFPLLKAIERKTARIFVFLLPFFHISELRSNNVPQAIAL